MMTDENDIMDRWSHLFEASEPVVPEEDKTAALTDPTNPESPFAGYIGNEKAVRRLCRAAAAVRMDLENSALGIALLGPASTGKTSLARRFSKCVNLPIAEIHPKSVKTIQDFFNEVLEKLQTQGWTASPVNGNLKLPHCVIFIDEVHGLSSNVVQGLLTATEANDGICDTGEYIFDCKNVRWLIATTDRGLLFDAFDTRFIKVFLSLYSAEEIAKIVGINYPDWSPEVCSLVAKYGGRIPREVLGFASEMVLEAKSSGSSDWEAIARSVAADNDVDEHGMKLQRVRILQALHERGPIAKARLPDVAGCKIEELERFVMPIMMAALPDRGALVTMTSRGYSITEAGTEQLKLRGLV